MHKQNQFVLVIMPTLASSLVSIGAAVLTLSITTFYYFSGNGAIYNLIFGKNSSVELIGQSRGTVDAISNTIFGNLVLNKILYFGFWMMVGLLVYLLLYILIKGLSSAAEDIEVAGYKNSRFEELKQAIATRLVIRAMIAIAWLIYWVVFVRTVLPFSILATRAGATLFPSPTSWLYLVTGTLILGLALQIHIIFLRLISLRVRLLDTS